VEEKRTATGPREPQKGRSRVIELVTKNINSDSVTLKRDNIDM